MRPSPSAAFLPSHDCTLRRGFGGFQLYLRLRARPVRFRGDRAGWLNRSAPPRSVAMLASTSRNRRETLSRASPSINSCRPLVTLLRPFGARETIWLASFLLLTGRTINRLFLAPLRYRKPTRQPRWRRPTDNLPYISSVAVLRCSGNEKPKGFVAKSPRARKKNWRRRLNRVGRVAGATCLKSATGNSAGLLLSRPRLRPAKTRRAILVQQETANGQPSERRIQGQDKHSHSAFPVQNRPRAEPPTSRDERSREEGPEAQEPWQAQSSGRGAPAGTARRGPRYFLGKGHGHYNPGARRSGQRHAAAGAPLFPHTRRSHRGHSRKDSVRPLGPGLARSADRPQPPAVRAHPSISTPAISRISTARAGIAASGTRR